MLRGVLCIPALHLALSIRPMFFYISARYFYCGRIVKYARVPKSSKPKMFLKHNLRNVKTTRHSNDPLTKRC